MSSCRQYFILYTFSLSPPKKSCTRMPLIVLGIADVLECRGNFSVNAFFHPLFWTSLAHAKFCLISLCAYVSIILLSSLFLVVGYNSSPCFHAYIFLAPIKGLNVGWTKLFWFLECRLYGFFNLSEFFTSSLEMLWALYLLCSIKIWHDMKFINQDFLKCHVTMF